MTIREVLAQYNLPESSLNEALRQLDDVVLEKCQESFKAGFMLKEEDGQDINRAYLRGYNTGFQAGKRSMGKIQLVRKLIAKDIRTNGSSTVRKKVVKPDKNVNKVNQEEVSVVDTHTNSAYVPEVISESEWRQRAKENHERISKKWSFT